MPEQIDYGDIATVGELRSICERIESEYGDDVEVTIQREDGFCVPPSPTFTEPEEWDTSDDGTLTLLSL